MVRWFWVGLTAACGSSCGKKERKGSGIVDSWKKAPFKTCRRLCPTEGEGTVKKYGLRGW